MNGDRRGKRQRRGEHRPAAQRSGSVDGVQQRQDKQRVRHHAMVELDRQRIFENVAPRRRVVQQARAIGNEAAVDQRPRIVDEPGCDSRSGWRIRPTSSPTWSKVWRGSYFFSVRAT